MNRRFTLYFTLLVSTVLFSGCAGKVVHMNSVPLDKIITTPEEGKSRVVFMRPATLGFAIQSSVFEVNEGAPSVVGIVAAKKKVSYQLDPGEHLFMVVGESADFMSAELEANKSYYALVTPRMGVWKARFSLKPVSFDELNSPEFDEWTDSCEWVEASADTEKWANENMNSIIAKQKKYYKKWMAKDISERPKLLPNDGK
jgi:hypothetical protein